jgi:hypothetical protein
MGLGQRASPAAGLDFLIQNLCQATQAEKRCYFNRMAILQRINWMVIHAFFKGMSPNSKPRIDLLNI